MVMKFTEPTGTIFDNYKTFKAFTEDAKVTKEELIALLDNPIYIKGTARYVARHVNCDYDVMNHMRHHPLWFVRLIGYFHYSLGDEHVMNYAKYLLGDGKEDIRILHHARRVLGDGCHE